MVQPHGRKVDIELPYHAGTKYKGRPYWRSENLSSQLPAPLDKQAGRGAARDATSWAA